MAQTDYLNELKELDILLVKNMFFEQRGVRVKNRLSPLQLKICKYLRENRGHEVSQTELEKELRVSRATISGTLLTMEKRGAIERATSEKDSRMKYVRLSEGSLKAFSKMQKRMDELNKKIVKDIPARDLEVFLEVLAAMKENLKIEVEDNI